MQQLTGMDASFLYAETDGFKVLVGIHTKGPMGMTFSYKYSDLSVNGKKVALPEPPKKEEKAGELKEGAKPAESPPEPKEGGGGGKKPE